MNCHLGNGSSLSAVKDGKCQDTSMGLTPLAGVPMGTRSGDIDPAVVQFVMNKYGMSADECLNMLNKKSGVLALSRRVLRLPRHRERPLRKATRTALMALGQVCLRQSASTSAPTPPLWADWTAWCSPPAWARIPLPCVRASARAWNSWASNWIREEQHPGQGSHHFRR